MTRQPLDPALDADDRPILDLVFSADGNALHAVDGFRIFRLVVRGRGPRRPGRRDIPD